MTKAANTTNAPVLLSNAELTRIIMADTSARRVLEKRLKPSAGDFVGVRLNLNILKCCGTPIQTVHKASTADGSRSKRAGYRGRALDYMQVVVLDDAFFNVDQRERESIARGEIAKHPMASVDGVLSSPASKAFFTGTELRFNPRLMHLFCDTDNNAVAWAERVTVFGHRVYAQGQIRYHTPDTAPPRAGDAPSLARVIG